jgi:hypothetical protein
MESNTQRIRSGQQSAQVFSRVGSSRFFEKLWAIALEEYDKEKGIGWEWQRVDGCMVKAPLAREAVGYNPTDI